MIVADSPERDDLLEREGKMEMGAREGEIFWDLAVWKCGGGVVERSGKRNRGSLGPVARKSQN